MKVLVVLHIFYEDQVPWFLDKLSHIHGCKWDLVVSYCGASAGFMEQIRSFKPDVFFIRVENEGFDVWPFIYVLRQVNLADYDVLVKLHTKGPTKGFKLFINRFRIRNYDWRDGLVLPFLGSDGRWKRLLRIFESKQDVGMVAPRKFVIASHSFAEDGLLLDQELERVGLSCPSRNFVAGTMFAVRPHLLACIRDTKHVSSDFVSAHESHSNGSLAHVYERILSICIPAQGYKICLLGSKLAFVLHQIIVILFKEVPLFIFELARDSKDPGNRKYIRLLGFRFFLEK